MARWDYTHRQDDDKSPGSVLHSLLIIKISRDFHFLENIPSSFDLFYQYMNNMIKENDAKNYTVANKEIVNL